MPGADVLHAFGVKSLIGLSSSNMYGQAGPDPARPVVLFPGPAAIIE
jgi:hypothetical protein